MTEVSEKPQDLPVEETQSTTPEDVPVEKTKTTGDITKLEADIIRQIEYYFGDVNLVKDKFLLECISKDDGWVPFSVLFTFKRLAALCTDTETVIKALEKSDEGLLEISEDRTKVRRHPERPIPEQNEERRKELASRTAYVKGFPLDADISDLIEFFNPFDKVANIIMRKYLDKPTKTYKFKGSVFVTFVKKDQCEEFINKEKVDYKGTELIRKWQEQYLEEKKEERNAKKKSKPQPVEDKIELPKGSVVYFEGGAEDITWEDIREKIQSLGGEVAYIDYRKGNKGGYVRLTTENSAQPFLDKLEDKKMKINDNAEYVFRILTEDEEKEFLTKAEEHLRSTRNQKSRKNNHRGNNHHRGGNRKRKASDSKDSSEPADKH